MRGGRSGARPPQAIASWLSERRPTPAHTGGVPPVRRPLVIEQSARRLIIRVADLEIAGDRLLLLEEQSPGIDPAMLVALRLSRRETEIVGWLTEGKTNPEIATILGISARTVQTHLDRVYRKLGVQTRTAAVARATARDLTRYTG